MRVARVLGIGELLWDLLPDGPRLGGAPFNVVAHLRHMGHDVALLSGVGDDERGRAALAEAARYAPDALVFGTLAQQSPSVRHATTGVIEAKPGALRVYDVNLREGC